MEGPSIRECLTAAIRYWEPRRIVYNLVLAAVVAVYYLICLPSSRHALTTDSILVLFLLAVLANVAYCAAYVVDIFAQMSNFRDLWLSGRWIVFVVGMAFAAVLTRVFSLGMFGVP
ncbi:MAG TPA: hypothetical protein VEJ00_04835 [Candidatus Acidoferrales bacterium]|jgi:hypothetical protein|nr:hypothetical protein [Candidatus Acidoferrales bacterium]